ncbi:MAG: ribonuclease HI family protein [Fimbriiglobus sp.]
MSTDATVHIDGGSRGNPGPAAYALTLVRSGLPVVEECRPIGTATNNVAEYMALVRALEVAAGLGVKSLAVISDSELLVKQMNGEYRVKNADLQELYRQATDLRTKFDRVTLTNVRRADNKRADFLCNEALDGRPRRAGDANSAQIAPTHVSNTRSVHAGNTSPRPCPPALEEEAVALLNAAAAAWAAGKTEPPAIAVWDRLWAVLAEHGVLGPPR